MRNSCCHFYYCLYINLEFWKLIDNIKLMWILWRQISIYKIYSQFIRQFIFEKTKALYHIEKFNFIQSKEILCKRQSISF